MKRTTLIAICTILVACGQSGTGSDNASEEISIYGTFVRGDGIDFSFYAANDGFQTNVFNYADYIDATEESEFYAVKDTARLMYTDLKMTYNYKTGSWMIEDIAFKEGMTTDIDLSGEYKQVE